MENTDLRLLIEMLKRSNVSFCVFRAAHDDQDKWSTVVSMPGSYAFLDGSEGGLIEEFVGDPDRTKGYSGFQSEFYFDASGQLVAVGAWE